MIGSFPSLPMQHVRDHFDHLADVRARFVRRNRYYYADLDRWLSYIVPRDARVVELGCGIGNIIKALPNAEKTGIDFSPKMVEAAKKHDHTGTQYLVDDIEQLKHAESYDY